MRLHGLPVERYACRLHTCGCRRQRRPVHFRTVHQRLRRNAADVQAGAADFVLFDQGHVRTELRRADRRHVSARTASDDEDLRLWRFLGNSRCAVAHHDRQQIAHFDRRAFFAFPAQHFAAVRTNDLFVELARRDDDKTLAGRDVLAGGLFPFFDHSALTADILRSDLHLRSGGDRHHSVFLFFFLNEHNGGAAGHRLVRLRAQFLDNAVELGAHLAVHIAEAHDAQKIALFYFIARRDRPLFEDRIDLGCIDFPDHRFLPGHGCPFFSET